MISAFIYGALGTIDDYDAAELKELSKDKDILCPVCLQPYEFCNGKIIPAYFRHKNKAACTYNFTVEMSAEHYNGERNLYDWIKSQPGINNCHIEFWLPETKQRPDIYFEYDNKRYVIEYQCTPLGPDEFNTRHELYKTAGINDIWIGGTEKYFGKNKRAKFMLDMCDYFYNSSLDLFMFDSTNYEGIFGCDYFGYSLSKLSSDEMQFTNGRIVPKYINKKPKPKFTIDEAIICVSTLCDGDKFQRDKYDMRNFWLDDKLKVIHVNEENYTLELWEKYFVKGLKNVYGSDQKEMGWICEHRTTTLCNVDSMSVELLEEYGEKFL